MWGGLKYRNRARITPCPPCLRGESLLTAPTRAPAAHAAVATAVPGHDGAADRATGGVAHVDQLFQRVGCVVVSRHSSPRNALRWQSHTVGVTEAKSRSLGCAS